MVVSQQLVQEVNGLVAHKPLILGVDKTVPGLLLEPAEDVVILRVELYFVLVQVVKQIVRAKHLGDLDELVRVAVAVEEGLLAEDHRGKHGAEAPHVQAVVILLEIHQQLGALEIARSDPHIVLGAGMVELGQAPVDQAQLDEGDCQRRRGRPRRNSAHLSTLMVDHNVMRLHIAVHNSLAVAVVEGLEQFKDVVTDIEVVELWVETPEVCVVDVLEDERGRLTLGVPHDVEEGDNVGAAGEILEDLDLTLDLLLLDGLENLDDAFLVIDDVDAFKDLGILAASCVESASQPAGRGFAVGTKGKEETNRSCARPRSSPGLPSLALFSSEVSILARDKSGRGGAALILTLS